MNDPKYLFRFLPEIFLTIDRVFNEKRLIIESYVQYSNII
jgi:hypothetical protein